MNLDDLFWQGITPEEALGRRAFSKVRALPPPVGLAPSCRRVGPHF
jgi:hypothetical protein